MSPEEIEILKKNNIPNYIRLGLQPTIVDQKTLDKIRDSMLEGNKMGQRYKALNVDEDTIKLSKNMEPESESMWYEADAPIDDPNKIVDNNQAVNYKSKHVIVESVADQIRQEEKQQRAAKPGEFIVILDGNILLIGNAEEAREICKETILGNKKLQDDDLVVYLRVPLSKLFK